jgi:hypothetical protein
VLDQITKYEVLVLFSTCRPLGMANLCDDAPYPNVCLVCLVPCVVQQLDGPLTAIRADGPMEFRRTKKTIINPSFSLLSSLASVPAFDSYLYRTGFGVKVRAEGVKMGPSYPSSLFFLFAFFSSIFFVLAGILSQAPVKNRRRRKINKIILLALQRQEKCHTTPGAQTTIFHLE